MCFQVNCWEISLRLRFFTQGSLLMIISGFLGVCVTLSFHLQLLISCNQGLLLVSSSGIQPTIVATSVMICRLIKLLFVAMSCLMSILFRLLVCIPQNPIHMISLTKDYPLMSFTIFTNLLQLLLLSPTCQVSPTHPLLTQFPHKSLLPKHKSIPFLLILLSNSLGS